MSRKPYKLVFFILGLIFLACIGLVLILKGNPREEYLPVTQEMPLHYNGKSFAGSQSCIPCHESIYRTHLNTAHYNTSALAEGLAPKGNFGKSENEVLLVGSHVVMDTEGDDHFQIAMVGKTKIIDKSKVDMIIGSGVKGQSHLTFNGDSLYQLPVSYFTLTDEWISSPGFPKFYFKRPVTDECIKCHVTFAKNADFSGRTNKYYRNSFLYGIDCERCHGPLQEHVDYRLGKKPRAKSDFVVKIDTLERQLQMDVCAQCHAGLRSRQLKGNPFSYVVGEKLEDYMQNYYSGRPQAELDVHGNQIGLLKSSECYKNSSVMNCTTCHSPHENQRDRNEDFNAKCIGCHATASQQHADTDQFALNNNCVQCHMPMFPSNTMKIRLDPDGAEKAVDIRTHLIGIYVNNTLRKEK